MMSAIRWLLDCWLFRTTDRPAILCSQGPKWEVLQPLQGMLLPTSHKDKAVDTGGGLAWKRSQQDVGLYLLLELWKDQPGSASLASSHLWWQMWLSRFSKTNLCCAWACAEGVGRGLCFSGAHSGFFLLSSPPSHSLADRQAHTMSPYESYWIASLGVTHSVICLG